MSLIHFLLSRLRYSLRPALPGASQTVRLAGLSFRPPLESEHNPQQPIHPLPLQPPGFCRFLYVPFCLLAGQVNRLMGAGMKVRWKSAFAWVCERHSQVSPRCPSLPSGEYRTEFRRRVSQEFVGQRVRAFRLLLVKFDHTIEAELHALLLRPDFDSFRSPCA